MSARSPLFLTPFVSFSAISKNIYVQSVPNQLSQTERDIIVDRLSRLPSRRERDSRIFDIELPDRPKMIGKQTDDAFNEASTQQFFYNRAKNDASAPQIPEVFDVFSSDKGDIMVMEKLEDAFTLSELESGLSEESAVQYAASAVKWLFAQLPWVPESCFGRISSDNAPVLHHFFKDYEAPGIFANDKELASFVSKVCFLIFPIIS